MNDPSLNIPEPSLPEHNLLREAGSLPRLTPGLRDRVLLNCHKQLRYGRRVDRLRVAGSVVAACLMVLLIWNCRWPVRPASQATPLPQDTASQNAPVPKYPYSSPGMISEDADATVETDAEGKPLPQGGPSIRRQSLPEMHQLDQMIEKLQNRHNVLCGLLPNL
jgi:hypothetical protein